MRKLEMWVYISQFWFFFSELQDINLQLWYLNSQMGDINYNSEKSHNSERESHNRDRIIVKSVAITFYFNSVVETGFHRSIWNLVNDLFVFLLFICCIKIWFGSSRDSITLQIAQIEIWKYG